MHQGFSYSASCFKLGIKPSTARNWERDQSPDFRPEWKEAKEVGEVAHLCFLEGISIDMMVGDELKGKGNGQILKFMLSALHQYSEKVETKTEQEINIVLPSMTDD